MRKKWLALALSMAMVVGSITGCGGSDSNKDASNSSKSNDSAKVETVADGGGKVLNIYVWNTEFKERFEKYYPDYNKDTQSIGDVKVKFVTNTNEGGVYQKKLDAALKKQDSASADDKIDMFLCEMDYVNKYTNTDMALDIKSLGLTDDDLSQMYDYTKQALQRVMVLFVLFHGRAALVDLFIVVLSQKKYLEQMISKRFRSRYLTGISSQQQLRL